MIKRNFNQEKTIRNKYREKHIKKPSQKECTACNGTGYYENTNNFMCESCQGTGKFN